MYEVEQGSEEDDEYSLCRAVCALPSLGSPSAWKREAKVRSSFHRAKESVVAFETENIARALGQDLLSTAVRGEAW